MKFFSNILILFISLLLSFSTLFSQWFDSQSLNTTVLLEKEKNGVITPHGTGVLFWNYKNPKFPIVITNAHLLLGSSIYVSINADSSFIDLTRKKNINKCKIFKREWTIIDNKVRCLIKLIKTPKKTFITHDSLDIGAFLIDMVSSLVDSSGNVTQCFTTLQKIPKSFVRKREDVSLGDELYFVGFPLGIGTYNKLIPVIRSASVAWLSPNSKIFLLDAFSYGGNSGSPIFSKRIIGREIGTISWDKPYFVGIVSGHIGQDIKGILTQPDPNRLIFSRSILEQNFGLVQCIWANDIMFIVNKAQELEITE